MVGSAKQATTNCAAVVVVGCTTAVACLLLHAVVAAGQRRHMAALKKEVERQEELRSAAHAGRVKAEKVDEELNDVSQVRYFSRVSFCGPWAQSVDFVHHQRSHCYSISRAYARSCTIALLVVGCLVVTLGCVKWTLSQCRAQYQQ